MKDKLAKILDLMNTFSKEEREKIVEILRLLLEVTHAHEELQGF